MKHEGNNKKSVKKETNLSNVVNDKKCKKNGKIINKQAKKLDKIFKEKKTYIFIVILCICLLVIILGITAILRNIEYKKYEHYEEKMNAYGFNKLYDNESAKTSDKVTKSEAVKMAIGVCLNKFDISGIAKTPTEEYKNAIWVLYAQDKDLVNLEELNKKTSKKKAKYVDVIQYFCAAKEKILDLELVNETSIKLSDITKYSEIKQEAILDMLSNDILQVIEDKLKGNRKIFKGQLNEIVVNYIEKYDLFGDTIQTDISKLPSNVSEYAYISADVEKAVYEIPFEKDTEEEFKSPKTSFTELKKYYNQIIQKVEKYYNTLINVNYQTITADNLKADLNYLTLSDASDEDINKYIEYLKNNQIKITGNAKVQKPIIYFDGMNYRVRTKIEFKVESSLTNDNLLYGDLTSVETIRYDNKENSVLADVRLGSALGTGTYYIKNSTLDMLIVGNKNPGIYKNNGL